MSKHLLLLEFFHTLIDGEQLIIHFIELVFKITLLRVELLDSLDEAVELKTGRRTARIEGFRFVLVNIPDKIDG